LRAEGVGHLKARQDGRVTFVVYTSDPTFPAPFAPEFELDDDERAQVTVLATKLEKLLSKEGAPPHVLLGAIATLGVSMASSQADDMTVEA
jgi:hypothetical protein